MKTVNNHTNWLPNILENMILESKMDSLNNYETFSIPKINIIENLPNFVVELAVPGLKKEFFTIEVEEDTLKISSTIPKKDQDSNIPENSKYTRKEFNFGDFKRSFKLPKNLKSEEIKADYENGILRITLPKMEEKKAFKKMVEIS